MTLTPLLAYARGVLRLAASRTLGRPGVRRTDRLARRTAYPGVVVALVGLVGYLASPVCVVLLLLLVAVVEWRIRAEGG